MGIVLSCVVLLGTHAFEVRAQAVAPPAEKFVRLEDLERLAAERNPTIEQADAILRAVNGRHRQASVYPNPLVGYGASDITVRQPGRGKHMLWVQQPIITAGKRRLVQQAIAQEQVHAEAEKAMQRQRVLNAVRALYYEALGTWRTLELRRQLASLARAAVDVSEDLYNVGQADRPDVIEVEIEAERADIDVQRAEHDLERVWHELAAMVGVPDLPLSPLAGDLEAEVPIVDEAAVRERVLRDSAEVRIARARLEHARASMARARADRVPNFFIRAGGGYNAERYAIGKDVGPEFFFEVGVPLPIFDRNQGSIAQAEAQVRLAEQELRRVELSLRTRFAGAVRNYRDAQRTVERYQRGVLAQAQRGYEMYLARFREMAASYPQVLIAQRTLSQVRAEYVRALVDLWQASVALDGELVTGGLEPPDSVPGEPAVTIEAVPFTVTP
jgi:cobalt-zinc-cadmium efflux system outer membrane protein